MDPEAVRRSLEPTASAEEITGSTPARLHFYDPFVLQGISIESAEHGRLLCSFVVAPRHASPAGYLCSGVTATLADQLGSAVFYCSGLPRTGVSVEINVSFVDVASVGEEIEIEGKLLCAGKSVGVVSVDFRKKKTGKLMAQARHTKYLAVSSRFYDQIIYLDEGVVSCNFTGNTNPDIICKNCPFHPYARAVLEFVVQNSETFTVLSSIVVKNCDPVI